MRLNGVVRGSLIIHEGERFVVASGRPTVNNPYPARGLPRMLAYRCIKLLGNPDEIGYLLIGEYHYIRADADVDTCFFGEVYLLPGSIS